MLLIAASARLLSLLEISLPLQCLSLSRIRRESKKKSISAALSTASSGSNLSYIMWTLILYPRSGHLTLLSPYSIRSSFCTQSGTTSQNMYLKRAAARLF
jgi:hypothetical protein